MINVAGHLREQNGTYQMVLSWKDETGKRSTEWQFSPNGAGQRMASLEIGRAHV